jgi:hypothetical protein
LIDAPKMKLLPQVRRLPLPGFEPVSFGAMWRGKSTPVLDAFLEVIQDRAKELTAA